MRAPAGTAGTILDVKIAFDSGPLGGKLTDGAPMYRVAPQRSTEETIAELNRHRASGYRQFQVKVGGDWATDIDRIRATVPLLEPGEKAMADANQGWRVDNALRVARATRDLDFIFEQPCRSYEECQQVRRVADHPMKLDECLTGMAAALGKAIITLHDAALTHPLKEVDAAALAVIERPAQAAEILAYVIEGALPQAS